MYISRTLQALVFKMKLIQIAGILQTAPHNAVCGTFKMCIVTL
jgi:hypothetical protein